jgi:hypothetical protein
MFQALRNVWMTRRAAADLLRRLKQNAVATCNLKPSAQPAAD